MSKKIIFYLILFVFIFAFTSFCYANEKVVLGANITEKSYKEKYQKGDTVTLKVTIDENSKKFGLLIGILKFDDDFLKINRIYKDGVNFYNEDGEESKISPKLFDMAVNENDQIVFWMEDKSNLIDKCTIGTVSFQTIKECSISDFDFEYINVQASDYDMKEKLEVEQNIIKEKNTKENATQTTKVQSDEKVDEELNDFMDKIEEEEKNKLSDIFSENDTVTSKDDENAKKDESLKVDDTPQKDESLKADDTSKKDEKSKENLQESEIIWSKSSPWAKDELNNAAKDGLIPNTFKNMDFTKSISRKNFAATAVKLYEKLTGKEAEKADSNSFNDTKDEYVLKAYSIGITEGTSKEKKLFSPENEITREQMATMLLRAIEKTGINTNVDIENVIKFEDDNEMHSWGRKAIYFMSLRDIIKGISGERNVFGVKNNATIEQALAISNRCYNCFKK